MLVLENTIDKIGDLQVLFPVTYSKLQNTDPSKFPELGNEYKSIFNEDLKSLIDNLIKYIDANPNDGKSNADSNMKLLKYENISLIKKDEYYKCFKLTADIGSKLINNYNPVDLFNFIDAKYYDSNTLNDSTKSDKIILLFHGLNLIQQNLLDTTKIKGSKLDNLWINVQELQKLNTSYEWAYFLGLIYQQDKKFFNHIFSEFSSIKKISDIDNTKILSAKKQLNLILSTLVELQNFRITLNDSTIQDNFIVYMNLLFKAIESANFRPDNLSNSDFQKFSNIANYTMNIYDNARKKDYNNSIYYLTKILNEFVVINKDASDMLNKIELYGTFMTDVINAKNSDDIKKCIKEHVAPPASFLLKREYQRTLSITGMPGYFISFDKFDGSKQKFAFESGITLPMGFDLTFKQKNGVKNSSSFGLFFQLVDLGAVLNFRLSDSTSTLPQKINFQQVFSPGVSLNYGFKNSPLTLGIGYQYTPELRQITLSNGNQTYPNGNRIFFRLAWDIPLINIAKSKSK